MKPMRIFYAVSKTPNSETLLSSNLWYLNLHPPLVKLGHEVLDFEYDFTEHFNYFDLKNPEHRAFIDINRPILDEHLLRQVSHAHREKPIDLFFSYFYDAFVSASTIDTIRAMGIPTVNFFCNAVHQFHLIETLAPHYDVCMVPELEAMPKYQAVGAHPIHIQMAANPEFYKPYPLPITYPVTFVGQKYLNRPDYMVYLVRHGVPAYAFGPGWWEPTPAFRTRLRLLARHAKGTLRHWLGRAADGSPMRPEMPRRHCGPPLSDDDLVKMYSRSAISLNFSEVSEHRTGAIKRHIRLRDFEAPMSGAFYFTGAQDELQTYYEPGKEIVIYDSREELLDKVRYYLRHENEARRIREAGMARARRDHTWENRFRQLFAEMKLA